MKVLVSGGRGLIGTALAADLLAAGHHVVPLVRPGAATAGAVGWDPAAGTVDRRALADRGPYAAVVHLAGAGIGDRRWSAARRAELRARRVGPPAALAGALGSLDPAPAVLVSASAVGVYGDRGDEELTEQSPPGSGFLAEVCQAWEAATAPAAAAGIRVVTLRSGVVLTPGGGALGKQLALFRLGLGGRLGNGRQYLSWITLADEVAAIRHALAHPEVRGPLNATAPGPVTNAEFTRALGHTLHRPTFLAVPRAALAVGLGAQLTAEVLLASQRAVPGALEAAGFGFAHPEIGGALAALLTPGP